MFLSHAVYQTEPFPELRVHRVGGVAHHFKATALRWSVRGEACYDHVAAGPDGFPGFFNVPGAIRRIGEKMENSPIMPYRIPRPRKCGRQYIGLGPRNVDRSFPESVSSYGERCSGYVQNRHFPVTCLNQPID